MISKKIAYLLKISLIVIASIGISIGTMYIISKIACRKKTESNCTSHCCSHEHKHNEHKKCHTH